ncbi:MAG TPA: VOC family protein [Mycobacteriales bacterium]|jgi:hypothetical protein|nr:VOC family protein [Mycobacteriales bacterium]
MTARSAEPEPKQHPRFNHVAMTVPADLLDEAGRTAILDFYGEVFGWQELPTETIDRQRLVMMAYEFGQFVFIEADDNPMTTNTIDHFGMSVSTQAELEEFYDRAKAFSERDERTILEPKMLDEFGDVLELHAFYVRHILPLKVEVQYFNWKQATANAG